MSTPKRPRDTNQLAKVIVDVATSQDATNQDAKKIKPKPKAADRQEKAWVKPT